MCMCVSICVCVLSVCLHIWESVHECVSVYMCGYFVCVCLCVDVDIYVKMCACPCESMIGRERKRE